MKPGFYLLMGVSGCGKTTVGKALASRLGWDFYDADAYHPPENISKMSQGFPLDDQDRIPWLNALHDLVSACLAEGRHGVLACSALKHSYREILLSGNHGMLLVYLKGDYDLVWSRMSDRTDHYMKPEMLKSQYEALEEPAGGLMVDISQPVGAIVDQILEFSEYWSGTS